VPVVPHWQAQGLVAVDRDRDIPPALKAARPIEMILLEPPATVKEEHGGEGGIAALGYEDAILGAQERAQLSRFAGLDRPAAQVPIGGDRQYERNQEASRGRDSPGSSLHRNERIPDGAKTGARAGSGRISRMPLPRHKPRGE